MIITFEASANIDTSSFGFFTMEYDPDLFSDIKENLTEISKDQPLDFKLDTDSVKLLVGQFHTVRRIISISDIEEYKFTNVLRRDFKASSFKKFKSAKLHIENDYFYFTGYYESSDKAIEFQSLNFDVRFIDSIEHEYKKCKESVVN